MTPLTPLMENTVVPETQLVDVPVRVRVIFPECPDGMTEGEAATDAALVTVKLAVVPTLLSVIGIVPVDDPVVRDNVAVVSLVTDMELMDAPPYIIIENRVLAVSCVQTVPTPVRFIVMTEPVDPEEGEMLREGVTTDIDTVEFPSVMFRGPPLEPDFRTIEADVVDDTV